MPTLALVRHGPTQWNAEHRLQGRTDTLLSTVGVETVKTWRLPDAVAGFRWWSSPLRRTHDTAKLLGAPDSLTLEPLWQEMSWGDWEGRTLEDLRSEFGPKMGEWERMGLDFKAPNGESPRDVQARITRTLPDLANQMTDTLIVTHKGVLRAAMALATGWDFLTKPPHKLQDSCIHFYEVTKDSELRVIRMNVPLCQ